MPIFILRKEVRKYLHRDSLQLLSKNSYVNCPDFNGLILYLAPVFERESYKAVKFITGSPFTRRMRSILLSSGRDMALADREILQDLKKQL